MTSDYLKKKDFMVKWIDNKDKIHKTKVIGKFTSASQAAQYISLSRKTCKGQPTAWWI